MFKSVATFMRFIDKNIALSLGLCAALYIFSSICDPFGVKTAAEEQSARIINLVYSKLYDGATDRTLTVMIDDEGIDNLNESYPLSLNVFSNVLLVISQQKPKAVFFDILFKDKSLVELKNFAFAVEYANLRGVRVYLMDPGEANTETDKFIRSLVERSPLVRLVGAKWDIHALNITYPRYESGPSRIVTPAWAVCEDLSLNRENCPVSGPDEIEVRWKTSSNSDWSDGFGLLIELISRNIFRPNVSDYERPLVDWTKDVELQTTTLDNIVLGKEVFSDLQAIDSRVVVIGQNVSGLNDSVRTAISDSIPGPIYHSMAIENFLSEKKVIASVAQLMWAADLAIALVLFLLTVLVERRIQSIWVAKINNESAFKLFCKISVVIGINFASVVSLIILGTFLYKWGLVQSMDLLAIIGAVELTKMLKERIS